MCFFIKYSIFRRGIPLRWENLCGSFFIFLCRPSCLYSLCVYIQTEIWHSTNSLNLQFAPPDNVVLQDDNWCQTLVLITGKHFCDVKSNSYDIKSMKFDSNVSIKIIFKTLGSYFSSERHSPAHGQKLNLWHMSYTIVYIYSDSPLNSNQILDLPTFIREKISPFLLWRWVSSRFQI